jgi:hypothetical protein
MSESRIDSASWRPHKELMKASSRKPSTPVLVWSGAAAVLALTWLVPGLRQAVVAQFGLYAAVAIVCGMGAVALRHAQPGLMRQGAIVLLLVLSGMVAVGWKYANRAHPQQFSWPAAIVVGLGGVLLPILIAALYANEKSGAGWIFARVTSLSLLAAPLSLMGGLILGLWIFHEGP